MRVCTHDNLTRLEALPDRLCVQDGLVGLVKVGELHLLCNALSGFNQTARLGLWVEAGCKSDI